MAARSDLLIAYGKAFGCRLVTAFLHKNVNAVSVLVDGSSKIMQLTTDLDKYLVEMPDVT